MGDDRNFTTAFTVDRTPREAFAAVVDVRGWWSEDIEGGTARLGDEFTYRLEGLHRCTMRLTEVVPDEKVSWLVLDNHFDFTRDQSEWTGTEVVFEIADKGGQTEVHFTHRGLMPDHECFDVCSDAWGFYINASLHGLITTGQGRPNKKK